MLTRLTNEEVAETVRVLGKIEDLGIFCDDIELSALVGTRKRLKRMLEAGSGISSLQGFQDAIFAERAREALLDQDQKKHDLWAALASPAKAPDAP